MQKKIFKNKNYKHIDTPFDSKMIESKIKNKDWILHHGFYPFISYSINFKKFSKELNADTHHHWKIKERPIKYASHIDRYIYQWYSYLLNNAYNDYCKKNDISDSAIAYRTCLRGKTNIEFTKIAFDFIRKSKSCYVFVSDFSSFFDFIEHEKLKKNLCKVLDVSKLDDDVYKVFKSMTKYAHIERSDIESYLIDNKIETNGSIKKNKSFFQNISWNDAKNSLRDKIVKNKEVYGIPQGSPLSGVFANIYMIDFDSRINSYVKEKKGLYMRYSDDLLVVIPKSMVSSADKIWDELLLVKSDYAFLEMNKDKTSVYSFEQGIVKSMHDKIPGMKKSVNSIDFLGFTFDGKFIKFRDKTLTKFYYKLYGKIDSMLDREVQRIEKGKKRKTKIDKKYILKELKVNNSESRKFIDYVQRAKRVYPNEKYIVGFKKNAEAKIFKRFNQINFI